MHEQGKVKVYYIVRQLIGLPYHISVSFIELAHKCIVLIYSLKAVMEW